MARDLVTDTLADGSTLFVATDGPVTSGAGLERLVSAANADVAVVVSVGAEAVEAASSARMGTVRSVAEVTVGADPEHPSRLSSSLSPVQGATTAIDDPTELGEVGQAVNRFLSDEVTDGDRALVIVNSVSTLLRSNTTEHVFYFMHLLIGLIQSRGGVGLFTYDIAKHETVELATLAELVDGVAVEPGLDEDGSFDLSLPEPVLGERVVNSLVAYTPVLWILAVLTFGMTDIITTYIGLATGVAYEASPLAAAIFGDHRFGFIYVAKAAVFVLFFLIWRFVPTPYNVSIPLGLLILGVMITAWNTYVIFVGHFA